MADRFDIKAITEITVTISETMTKMATQTQAMEHVLDAVIVQLDQPAADVGAHVADILDAQPEHTLSGSTHEAQDLDENRHADDSTVAVHVAHDTHDVASDGTEA